MATQLALTQEHREEIDRLLVRAAEEEVRRSDGRVDGRQLLQRARSTIEEIHRPALEEYAVYRRAAEEFSPASSATASGSRPSAAPWRPPSPPPSPSSS